MTTFAMTRRSRRLGHATSLSAAILLALLSPKTSSAQLIAVRTIPIADADQFSFFPSRLSGMGGVSIAIADSVHDPFINPATGARLRHSLFFSAPTLFSVSGDAGRGSAFPLGVLARTGTTFGGAAAAIQSINDAQPLSTLGPLPSGDESRSNHHGFLMLGRQFAASGTSVGASVFWSDLGAIDGTSRLYLDSRGVSQAGRAADIRVGILKEWVRGQSLEALVFSRRMAMTHDVTYGDLYWDPIARQTVIRDRFVHAQDRTNTLGVHVEYTRPIGDSGWRAGVIVTANRVDNPGRPAYEFETIPGSRGRSSAFNVGVGIVRSLGRTTLAADAIYEPILSRFWGVSDTGAAAISATAADSVGLDSRLRFSNAILRTGLSHDLTLGRESTLQLQFGVEAHSIYYTLDQRDPVNRSTQERDRNWMEWTRTWGATLRRASVEVHYRSRKMTGAGRPGMSPGFFAEPPARGPIIGPFPAPSALPATLRDVSVVTHQLSLSLRIR
ncbi:MAG: hypothetical protein ACT4P6_04445 [Gemmatimonadaceae bacterium]